MSCYIAFVYKPCQQHGCCRVMIFTILLKDVCRRLWMFPHLEEHLNTVQELPERIPFFHRQQVFLIAEIQAHAIEVVYE